MVVKKFNFHKRGNSSGELVFLESCIDIPFAIKRVYYIYGVEQGCRRGFHAHKTLQQAIICIHGSCRIMLDDGQSKADVALNDPSEGLFVGASIWREMYDFSADAVLLVLASEYYDEQDYIRDYSDFVRYIGGGK